MNVGEVWAVDFPFEDDPNKSKIRPCIIMDVDTLEVLSIKVTTHESRKDVIYDFLYRMKNKSKRIPYYNLKESFVNSINMLNRQVDNICMRKLEYVQSEKVTEMVNNKRLMTVDELIKADIITAAGSAILGASIAEFKGAIIGGTIGLLLFLIVYFCETSK
jgi:hypothetical protein